MNAYFCKLAKDNGDKSSRRLVSLRFGKRMARYGCDRYLNPLKKAPRLMRPKVYKPRPYPTWLVPHMFGNREQPLRGLIQAVTRDGAASRPVVRCTR